MHLLYHATAQDEGKDIKTVARELLLSAAMLKRFKYHGKILKNNEPVFVTAKVAAGDEILFFYEEEEKSPKVFPKPVIVYEDEYIIALDKPAGLATHPAPKSGPSLAEEVVYYLGGGVFRAVNRLDKPTSGLVLAAKDPHTAGLLNRAMAEGHFEKNYRARLCRAPEPPEGEVSAPILSVPKEQKRIIAPSGKSATTRYRLLSEEKDKTAWIEAMPITGRTHQIRLHMAHIGCPLYADELYGTAVLGENLSLRCVSMKFLHPYRGEMQLKVE
ncbi:MAG: RluA family pseudouridine synthase [Clostridia bacterium]|nr:RluA family pseudouridine synthase [Clostridia bacterium]